jgi:predicted metal-dependent peptidase
MGTEEIYELILSKATKIKVVFGGNGDGKCNDPGGCGGVMEPGKGKGDKASADAVAREWEATVRMAVNAARAHNAGKVPGYLERLVTQLKAPKKNWRDETRNFVDQSMVKDYSWTRPNRRYLSSGLYLPGMRSDSLHHLVCFIDLSGSVNDKMKQCMVSEVAGALDQGVADHLTVVYVDTEVRHVDEFQQGDIVTCKVLAGGGTDFAQPFQWLKETIPDASCVIFLTDMCTSSWGEEPECPVLWGAYLPEHMLAHYQPPFGKVITVDTSE